MRLPVVVILTVYLGLWVYAYTRQEPVHLVERERFSPESARMEAQVDITRPAGVGPLDSENLHDIAAIVDQARVPAGSNIKSTSGSQGKLIESLEDTVIRVRDETPFDSESELKRGLWTSLPTSLIIFLLTLRFSEVQNSTSLISRTIAIGNGWFISRKAYGNSDEPVRGSLTKSFKLGSLVSIESRFSHLNPDRTLGVSTADVQKIRSVKQRKKDDRRSNEGQVAKKTS